MRSEDKEAVKRSIRPGATPIEHRLAKPSLGYTVIHGLIHFHYCIRARRSLAEIEQVLDLLLEVCYLFNFPFSGPEQLHSSRDP